MFVDSPWTVGTVKYDGLWSAFEFRLRVQKLSFDQFDINVNDNTLKFGKAVLSGNTWISVRVAYDQKTKTLEGLVNGKVVSRATVLKPGMIERLRCKLSSDAGQNAVFEMKDVRVWTGDKPE